MIENTDRDNSTTGSGPDPVDAPLLTVLRNYEQDGYTSQFASREGGVIHCFSCGTDSPAGDCVHGEIYRLEGASDPADMLAVMPMRCPHCDAMGTVVANYGPESGPADAEVLLALERGPRTMEQGT